MDSQEPSFGTRIWLALTTPWRVLFSSSYAAHVAGIGAPREAALPSPEVKPVPPMPERVEPRAPEEEAALVLLSLFQRNGRLVDFLEEDVSAFSDAEIGAAAREVHKGCRSTLREHFELKPVHTEAEGGRVVVEEGFSPSEIRLVGNVGGAAPFRGVLQHRGWRIDSVRLPTLTDGHDARVIAPAEVEVG